MQFQRLNSLKIISLLFMGIFFISHIIASIFRYNKAPEWFTVVQGAFIFIWFLFLLFWFVFNSKLFQDQFLTRIIILGGYFCRGLIAIINEYIQLLPNLSDVSYYHSLGIEYARELSIQGGGFGASAFGSYFIGAIYFLIGSSPVVINILNSFVYSVTIIVLIKICNELGFKNFWVVALFGSLLPSSILYIPVLLRESIFLFCSIYYFYQMIVLFGNKKGFLNHIMVVFLILLCSLIRPQIFPIFLLIYLITLIYYQKGLLKVFSFILLFIFVPLISILDFALFQFIDSDLFNLYYFQMYRNAFFDLPSAYLVDITYKGWFDFFSYIPEFIMYFLFTPFPWISSNYKYFLATVDSLISMFIIVSGLFIVFYNASRWKMHLFPVLIGFLVLVVPFAMIEAYPMGAVRHRMIVTLMMLPVLTCIIPRRF